MKTRLPTLIVLTLLVLGGCGGGAHTSTFTGSVILTWSGPDQNTDGTDLTDLEGYRIYYRNSINESHSIISVGNTTTTIVEGIKFGIIYYFKVTALDITGNESAPSIEVSITLS